MRMITVLLLTCAALPVLSGCASRDTSADTVLGAEYLIRQLDYEEAIRLTDTVITGGGDRAREAYRLKGIALFKTGRYEEANEAFIQALSLTDGVLSDMDIDISLYRALALRRQGLYAEACTVYDNILALHANDARTLYAKGCCLLEEDKLSDAYRCFDEAGKAAGGSEELNELYVLIYRALDSAGYKEAALNQLEAGLQDTGLSGTDRSRLLYYLGRTEDEEGLDIVEQKNLEGLRLMAGGEYEQAAQVFEEGLSLQEEDMQQALMRNRIAAYEYAGNFGTAAQLMEEYSSRYPEDLKAERELVFLRTR